MPYATRVNDSVTLRRPFRRGIVTSAIGEPARGAAPSVHNVDLWRTASIRHKHVLFAARRPHRRTFDSRVAGELATHIAAALQRIGVGISAGLEGRNDALP